MTEQQFIQKFQADPSMTRDHVRLALVETSDGYLLARASSPFDIAYCASRTASKALGRAASASAFGDFRNAEAFETPEEALEHARNTPYDYH